MKKNVLISMSLLMVLSIAACGKANDTNNNIETPEITAEPLVDAAADAEDEYQDPLPAEEDDGEDAPEVVTDEQALEAVKNFVLSSNHGVTPEANGEEVTEYYEVESSTGEEIVVLYRSYTASQTRFYIERATGHTEVTELVPGIIDEETSTGESFNIWNYIFDDDDATYTADFLRDGMWYTASMNMISDDVAEPEWTVIFDDMKIVYGHIDGDEFIDDHTDTISSIEQDGEHSYTIQAESADGIKYTYKTSEDDENILEYYETWDESKFAESYSGSASLFR